MSDRELLKAEAEALGIEVSEDVTDEELATLLTAASERAKLEIRATELGVEFAANIGDKKLAQRIEAAEKAASEKSATGGSSNDEDEQLEGSAFTVHCAIAGGRRRAGRRWPGGATPVAAGDLTEDMLAQLKADPLFHVTEIPAE